MQIKDGFLLSVTNGAILHKEMMLEFNQLIPLSLSLSLMYHSTKLLPMPPLHVTIVH